MTLRNLAQRLRKNRSGVAMIEFAMGAPFLLMAGLYGTEMANYALVNMRISQLAEHVADNASRVGDTSTLQNRRIYESDINEVIFGAQLQGGTGLDLYENGRVIVSSVQVSDAGNQYIHWQRCRGAKNITSDYGSEGADLGSDGIGPEGEEVLAMQDDALIFVELNYTYQPLVSEKFMGSLDIHAIASFTVRDDRDISQIYQRDPASPDPVQTCNQFKGRPVVGTNGSFS